MTCFRRYYFSYAHAYVTSYNIILFFTKLQKLSKGNINRPDFQIFILKKKIDFLSSKPGQLALFLFMVLFF
jgi:hypothetical protein